MCYDNFMNHYEEEIIESWWNAIDKEMPDMFEKEVLYTNAKLYYQFFKDIEIPTSEHPNCSILPRIAQFHVARNTPIFNMIRVSHLWCNLMLDKIHSYMEQNQIPYSEGKEYVKKFIYKFDECQYVVVGTYWDYLKGRIEENSESLVKCIMTD